MRGLSFPQRLAAVIGLGAGTTGLLWFPETTAFLAMTAIQLGFLMLAAFRIVLVIVSRRPFAELPIQEPLPTYTILVALYDEAEIVPQLVTRLATLDYPTDRLQGLLLIEAEDTATLTAAERENRPIWLDVVAVPPGKPMTKPRALNHGLELATGTLLTVYDAEDSPDPFQLKEAAARFAARSDEHLACLQAPLRMRRPDYALLGSDFFQRQFAVEYAALFEVTVPGLARLGLPFPLGGTSNHFRTDILRAVGGWDAFNVTEDADLGFRLWRQGWRLDTIRRPTFEAPTTTLEDWLPQRARWLKGFMQTWGVHTRDLPGLKVGGLIALCLTIGGTLASAALHALAISWLVATVLIALLAGMSPVLPVFALAVMFLGTAAAWLSGQIGARRAGVQYSANDMVMSPVYWSLMSLAFAHAAWRLLVEPFIWDKTRHQPDILPVSVPSVSAGRRVV